QDTLSAGHDDDILIGGSYQYSSDLDAVYAAMAEWKSSATYAARMADLRAGGADGLYAFTITTLQADNAADSLYGSQGQDWFWAYALDQYDQHGNETNP